MNACEHKNLEAFGPANLVSPTMCHDHRCLDCGTEFKGGYGKHLRELNQDNCNHPKIITSSSLVSGGGAGEPPSMVTIKRCILCNKIISSRCEG